MKNKKTTWAQILFWPALRPTSPSSLSPLLPTWTGRSQPNHAHTPQPEVDKRALCATAFVHWTHARRKHGACKNLAHGEKYLVGKPTFTACKYGWGEPLRLNGLHRKLRLALEHTIFLSPSSPLPLLEHPSSFPQIYHHGHHWSKLQTLPP